MRRTVSSGAFVSPPAGARGAPSSNEVPPLSPFQHLSPHAAQPQEIPTPDAESKNEDHVAKVQKLYTKSVPGGSVPPRAKAVVAKSVEQHDDGQAFWW